MNTPTDSRSPRGLAVVTGASVGIGQAAAQALEKVGYTVIAASRRLPPPPAA